MIKRNTAIALIIVISLVCMFPSLIERISYEKSHTAFEVAPVLTEDMTKEELEKFKENDITLMVAEENFSKFDESQISLAREIGLDIALKINIGEKSAEGFEKKLDLLVKENNVKYILISKVKTPNTFDAPIENVIEENAMTVVLCENIKQLSNEKPEGYDRYIEASDGRLMRSYITFKNPAVGINSDTQPTRFGELLYHHMANSLRDRNTEFITLNVIENDSLSRDEAIEETIFAAKKLKKTALKLGYVEGKDVSLNGYVTDVRVPTMAAVMLGTIMGLVLIELIFKKRISGLEWAFCILALILGATVYALPENILFLVPTAFAPLSAMFSFTVTAKAITYIKSKKVSFVLSLLFVFAVALLSLFIGAANLGAMLSGSDYYLNTLVFRGVKLSLVLPIIYAIVYMCIEENICLKLSPQKFKTAFSKIKLYHIIILALVALAAFVYVMRSGNAKISPFENAFRNFIADISGARPRTKEFLIGWPILTLAVYFIHHSVPKLFTNSACIGSSVLFASVTNTFCHVFTDFYVSTLRTFNGLLFSLPIIVIVIFLASLFKKLFLKNNSL